MESAVVEFELKDVFFLSTELENVPSMQMHICRRKNAFYLSEADGAFDCCRFSLRFFNEISRIRYELLISENLISTAFLCTMEHASLNREFYRAPTYVRLNADPSCDDFSFHR